MKKKKTNFHNIPLYVGNNYKINPLIIKARKDDRVKVNTSSVGECSFISMTEDVCEEYPGIDKYETSFVENIHYKF